MYKSNTYLCSKILEIYKASNLQNRYVYIAANIAGIFSFEMTLTPETEVIHSSFPVIEGLFLELATKL
jgi:hypothetical protein